ncbi:MAG: hypothetical protein ACM3H7_00040, partial [Acidobacteriaceae bacterium]
VHGRPLHMLRQLARSDGDVEDVQMFGDRLHIRLKVGSAPAMIERFKQAIALHGGQATLVRQITPQLEDVFINLLETRPSRDHPGVS